MPPIPKRDFELPPAVWLPNTSFIPFSVSLFFFTGILLGSYIVFHFYAPFEIEWWMTATWLGVATLLITLFVQVLVVRRINFLSAVVQQDPRLVAGDAVAFGLMKRLPCAGRCREVDTLQKSLVNLYRASFKGRNVVYDGFTQRSVISCDYDVRSEQRPFGADSDFGDDDDNHNHSWEDRTWYNPDDDALEEGADRDQVDLGQSAPASARSFFSMGGGNNTSRSILSARTRGGGGPHRRNSVGPDGQNFSGGAHSLQRALLLSGVDPNQYSNPNTPRGSSRVAYDTSTNGSPYVQNDSATSLQQYHPPNSSAPSVISINSNDEQQQQGGNYGSTSSYQNSARSFQSANNDDDGLVSARSVASTTQTMVSARSTTSSSRGGNSNNAPPAFSPRDIMLADIEPQSPNAQGLRRHISSQPTWMQYDPLGDNNSSVPYHEVLMQGIPDTGTSLLVSIVKQISPGTPLSAITFPVHVLEPRSLLEKFADMFRHAGVLVEAAKHAGDPSFRLQQVTKFFLSAYYLQHGARKPYNPLHGEVFGARLELPHCDGKVVNYIAEQVSHHPPVTFIRASCQGVFEFKAVYHAKTSLVSINCASSVGEGGMELKLFDSQNPTAPPATYSLSWPTLFVSGFLYGSMKLELGGSTNVVDQTSSRARAKVDFARKGWISGEYDVVQAVFGDTHSGVIDEKNGPGLEGHWNREIYHLPNRGNGNKNTRTLIWNGPAEKNGSNQSGKSSFARLASVLVPNHNRQSRAIWQKLTQSLRQQDVPKAVAAKHEVEEAQRAWRKALAAKNQKHYPRLFVHQSQHLAQFPAQELWDLSKWQDTEECTNWFKSQTADVQMS